MLYGVIDVGSNSVRLMMHDGKKTLYKKVKITRLAENMGDAKILTDSAIDRSAKSVTDFVRFAKEQGADKIYAFATAAVRYARNSAVFLSKVKNLCGVDIEVVSGDIEAELGYRGALNGKDGGVIDIGGASAEIITCEQRRKTYGKSLDIGVVKIKDVCGQDERAVARFLENKIKEYGNIPIAKFYGIGGTATSIAAMLLELQDYNPDLVNGFVIKIDDLVQLTKKLFSMTVEQRKTLKGLQPERAEVIAGGSALLLAIMKKIGIDSITVSESDNLEGYLMMKTERI